MTKIQKQGLLREDRLIYVSWYRGEEAHAPWVEHFWLKVLVEAKSQGCDLGRTDGDRAGDRYADKDIGRVTDMVAVLTGTYLHANQDDERDPKERELARFIQLREQEHDIEDAGSKRAWLAPLERFTFHRVVVGGLRLSEEKSWLQRPRDKKDGEVYTAPPGQVADREMAALVDNILSQMENDSREDRGAAKAGPAWKGWVRRLTGILSDKEGK